MNKQILFLALIVLSFLSCNKSTDPNTITLITTGYPDSTILFLGNSLRVDTGYIINNHLVFTTPSTTEPSSYGLFPVIKSRADMDIREVWKENKAVTVRASKGNLKHAIVEGSAIQQFYDESRALHDPLEQKDDSLKLLIRSLDPVKDLARRDSLIAESHANYSEDKRIDSIFITTHPNNFFSAYILNYRLTELSTPLIRNLYNLLDSNIQNCSCGLNIKKYIALAKDVKKGDPAIDFSLPNLDGKLISLSSFQGKYLLLEFWATGCGPCRMENPNLLKNYQKYHAKGFDILGVTFDESKDHWKNTVKTDSMIWNTVGDLKGFNTDVALTYKVSMIPTNYLINPEGIIIAKNLRREQLGLKLDSIFTNLPNSKHHE